MVMQAEGGPADTVLMKDVLKGRERHSSHAGGCVYYVRAFKILSAETATD